MARLQPAPPFSPAAPRGAGSLDAASPYDAYLDLGRLLSRLDQNILRADGDRWRRLVGDEFQRLQARFDVTAADRLLTRVEQEGIGGGSSGNPAGVAKINMAASSPSFSSSSSSSLRQQDVQGELRRRRALVERLQERLDDLDAEARAAAEMDDGDSDMENKGENEKGGSSLSSTDDVLAHVLLPMTPPSESLDSRASDIYKADGGGGGDGGLESSMETTAMTAETQETRKSRKSKKKVRIAKTHEMATATATATAAPTMRARKVTARSLHNNGQARTTSAEAAEGQVGLLEEADQADQETTEPRLSTMRQSLFSSQAQSPEGSIGGVAAEEVVLDHHRQEQEVLSEDILRLARALKEQSLATSQMLTEDKDVVDRVGEGLHTTNENLSAASRSMALLSRMTEGKGWWGRMMLFGMVYGLMLVLVLLFVFLPKLRL